MTREVTFMQVRGAPLIFCRGRTPELCGHQAKRMHQLMRIDMKNYIFFLTWHFWRGRGLHPPQNLLSPHLEPSLPFKRKQVGAAGKKTSGGAKNFDGGLGLGVRATFFNFMLQGTKINDSLGPWVGDLLDTPLDWYIFACVNVCAMSPFAQCHHFDIQDF